MTSALNLLFGSGPGQQIVVLGAITLYVYLFARRPDDAKDALRNGLVLFGRMFTLILAALGVAAAIQTIVSAAAIRSVLGDAAGLGGTVLGGLLGGVVPGGPYAVYPIVSGVFAAGAGVATILAMLVGYGAIGGARVPYGLVFFDVKTVALRLAIGVPATAVVAVGVFLLI